MKKLNNQDVNASSLVLVVATHSIQHIEEVQNDLNQINGLLRDAITALTDHFIGLQNALEIRRNMSVSCPELERIEIENTIALHTLGAITALQFEDMTQQLNQRSFKRLQGLRQALIKLPNMASDSSSQQFNSQSPESIFSEECERLAKTISKSVHQTHLASGDVDLF